MVGLDGLPPRTAVIVSAARTPLGAFQGSLASFTATELGAYAIRGALERAGIRPGDGLVDEVLMGNVITGNLGQAPATQASLGAGLPPTTPCTTINKVCSSGLKAVMLAAQAIAAGSADVIVAGGMESMSNAPYYAPGVRRGLRMGDGALVDGVVRDGLWDPYSNIHMGSCAELCAERYGIGRKQQDEHAQASHQRAAAAAAAGHTAAEIVPLPRPGGGGGGGARVPSPPSLDGGGSGGPSIGTPGGASPAAGGGGTPTSLLPLVAATAAAAAAAKAGPAATAGSYIWEDEGLTKMDPSRLPSLRPYFKRDGGTVTAGNASPLTDGAAALVVASAEAVRRLGLPALAVIRGHADANQAPEWFTTAPAAAVPRALARAGLAPPPPPGQSPSAAAAASTAAQGTGPQGRGAGEGAASGGAGAGGAGGGGAGGVGCVEYWEVNEAFSVVDLANRQLLGLHPDRVNAHGGSVALGHPIGASGARILVTLLNVLRVKGGRIGCAAICNGGGGASAVVVERVGGAGAQGARSQL